MWSVPNPTTESGKMPPDTVEEAGKTPEDLPGGSTAEDRESKDASPSDSRTLRPRTGKPPVEDDVYSGDSDEDDEFDDDGDGLQSSQCYWIHCTNSAREGSKYCSDDCGVKLAMCRIIKILPDKLEAFNETPCVADTKNKLEQERLRQKIVEATELLEALEGKRVTLDKFIEEVNQVEYQPGLESENVSRAEDNSSMLCCVLCGYDVYLRNYIVHIERCFHKIDRTVIAEGRAPTNLPGTKLFCEAFDRRAGTYCMRFDVLCSQHNKGKKDPNSNNKRLTAYSFIEICGSPQTSELQIEKVCRAAKSSCRQHYNWENLRRAEIDLQRWNTMIQLDNLTRKEAYVQQAVKDRRSVLGLLLHTAKTEEKEKCKITEKSVHE